MKKTRSNETGAAIAESVMVMTLIVLLFASVVQFGVIIYTRNTLVDAASAAARHAALADRGLDDGIVRAREVLAATIPRSGNAQVVGSKQSHPDGQEITIRIRHRVPMIGFVPSPVALEVTGRAIFIED